MQRLCYPAWGPCGPQGAPSRRVPGVRRPSLPGEVKPTPPPVPEGRTPPRVPVSTASALGCVPCPLAPRGETALTFPSFPQTSSGQDRRFPPTAARQPRLLHSAPAAPRLLSPSRDRSRSPGDSPRSLPGGSHESPPTAARTATGRWRPLPGHRAGAPWGPRGAGQRVGNMEPNPARNPAPPPAAHPFS